MSSLKSSYYNPLLCSQFLLIRVYLQFYLTEKEYSNWASSEWFHIVLIDFSLTVKAATLMFISGRGSAISSAKQGKSGSIYNLLKN